MTIKNKTQYSFLFIALFLGIASACILVQAPPQAWLCISTILLSLFSTFLIFRFLFELEYQTTLPTGNSPFKAFLRSLLALTPVQLTQESQSSSNLFLPNILEGTISSRAQFGQALAELFERSFAYLPIGGVKVSLYDKNTNFFFFSLLMGRISTRYEDRVLELPLTFSGKVLGSVKFSALSSGEFTQQFQEIAKLITLQVGVLFINAEYSSELLRMQRNADESLKAKTGFLANLSHEVRAPLGIIVNATELVLDGLCGEISDDQRRILGLAKNGSEHLLELLNDVLDYAKIEAGKLAPQKKDIPLQEVLKDVTTLIRFQAEQKKIEVDLRDEVDGLAVTADRKHLRQILINLLTNAVKYSPNGANIEVWAERAPGQMIRINVKDTGVGIDPSQRDKVFAPFERLNHSYSRQQAGVGLGLSLAKRLAEINGGALDFESKLGEGSRFWFVLKSADLDAIGKNESETVSSSLRGNGEELVVIDSDPDHLEILSKYLTDLGYKLKSYPNFSEASSTLECADTELVIMDNYELDDPQSGAGKAVTELVEKRRIPVLLLSSRAFIFDLEKYLKLGVERCLPKPVPLKELGGLCRELLNSRKAEQVLKKRDVVREQGSSGLLSGNKNSDTLLH